MSSTIPPSTLKALTRQFNHELFAAQSYLALSVWCEVQNFSGCAAFFTKQAGEEREHADKIIAHLVDRGDAAEIAAMEAPRQKFSSLGDVALHAQALEQANTRGINATLEAALVDKDYPAQVLMHWFVNEQVEEEAWAAKMVALVQRATCAGGLSSFDRHVSDLLGAGD
ncbi:MAG: ferritin [Candidatus Didemnitutus sp.]|nr:ferritin [Candidatus Didemnitutus sp.]